MHTWLPDLALTNYTVLYKHLLPLDIHVHVWRSNVVIIVFEFTASDQLPVLYKFLKFVYIATLELWDWCLQWMTKTSQSIPIRVMTDCLYTLYPCNHVRTVLLIAEWLKKKKKDVTTKMVIFVKKRQKKKKIKDKNNPPK